MSSLFTFLGLQLDFSFASLLWVRLPPAVFIRILSPTNPEVHQVVSKNTFLRHSISVYTNGFSTDDGVGFSAVFHNFTVSHTLPSYLPAFSDEMISVFMAVPRICHVEPEGDYTIFPDLRSTLQALLLRSNLDPLVSATQKCIIFSYAKKKSIAMCWVPPHVGASGNEEANRVAGHTASHRVPNAQYHPPSLRMGHLTATYIYASVRRGFLYGLRTY